MHVTRSRVRELFKYEDGALYIRQSPCKKMPVGKRAGCLTNGGYRTVRVDGEQYQEHHVIFLYHKGYLPKRVKHLNGEKDDNRIKNLEEVLKKGEVVNPPITLNTLKKDVTWM